MQSQDNTVISLPEQSITDAAGNVWSISNGQVAVNGAIDPTTANVIAMAYEGGLVWQENMQDLWWSKTAPDASWSPPDGTSADPIPDRAASANDTVLLAKATGAIFDGQNWWTIANGQVVIDGTPDPTTARVVALVRSGGQVWQQNADGLWWGKSSPTAEWSPQSGTDQAPTPDTGSNLGVNQVTLSSSDTPITDAGGNRWTIQNGQVALNGVVDPTTRNVTELAYVNGQVWQENADGLWWSKSVPADDWGPAYGTPQSPVPPNAASPTRIWSGQNGGFENPAAWSPVGVPQSGDTAIVGSGTVSVSQGYAAGVNFDLDRGAVVDFNAGGTFQIGEIGGSGTVNLGYAQIQPITVDAGGVALAADESLALTEYQHFGTLAFRGDSTLAVGSSLTIQQLAVNHTPYAPLENDGTMTLDGATFRVGSLSGGGVVRLTDASTMQVQTTSSDTIQLQSGHLEIGLTSAPSIALLFHAPITEFGSDSSITLDSTTATAEVFRHIGREAGELMLYDGTKLVADLHIAGQGRLFANFTPGSAFGGSVTISAHDDGHALPIVSHVG